MEPPSCVAPTRAPVWPTADSAGEARTRRSVPLRRGVRACEAREDFRSIEPFGGTSIASVRPSNCSTASRAPFGSCERRERPSNDERQPPRGCVTVTVAAEPTSMRVWPSIRARSAVGCALVFESRGTRQRLLQIPGALEQNSFGAA